MTIGTGDGGTPPLSEDQSLVFHPLTFSDDDDEVTVGRLDQGEFVVLPADGAALLRQLVGGRTCAQAAEWYLATYGEQIDVADFVTDLAELGFLAPPGTAPAEAPPVRWMRLGKAMYSPAAGVLYLALLSAAAIAMVRSPVLVPHYANIFFSPYLSLVLVTLFVGQMPFLLLHEAAHALAGRRLGLPSTLSIGRRLYFLVFLTTMDGLVTVPRRKRFLPILAGMLLDIGVLAGLTLLAAATRRPGGSFSTIGGVALALAYSTLLRLLWQLSFYLRTDIYYLVVTVLGCVDLHTTARQVLANWWRQRLGRPPRHDPDLWHPRDRRAARWYSVLIVVGYAVSIGTLAVAVLPAAIRMLDMVFRRFFVGGAQGDGGLLDSTVFLVLSLGEIAIVLMLTVRDRRRRSAVRHST